MPSPFLSDLESPESIRKVFVSASHYNTNRKIFFLFSKLHLSTSDGCETTSSIFEL